jgi:hypothetical protein
MGRWVTTAVFLAALGVGLFFWKRARDKDAVRETRGQTQSAEFDVGGMRSKKGSIRRAEPATSGVTAKPEREYSEEERMGLPRPEPQKLPQHIIDLNTKLGERIRGLVKPCVGSAYGPEQRIIVRAQSELFKGKTKLINPAVVQPKDEAFAKCALEALAGQRWDDQGPDAVFMMEASFLVKEL